jgi:hypothetical protein
MADDVKVKFGGDFTDVAKGAASAVGKAGATLGAWFADFQKSTAASVVSGLALSNILSTVVASAARTLELFKGIGDSMSRFGASGIEFQKLAKYGQEVGVSVEQVARATNYFGKVQKEAAKGVGIYAGALAGLGFTAEEIKSGSVSMTEVLGRLADMYDQTGNASLVSARATQIFGEASQGLMGIVQGGRKNMTAYIETVKGVSDEHAKKLEQMSRDVEKLKSVWQEIVGLVVKYYAMIPRKAESLATLETVMDESTRVGDKSDSEVRQMAEDMAKTVRSTYGKDTEGLKDFLEMAKKQVSMDDDSSFGKYMRTFISSLSGGIKKIERAEEEKQKSVEKAGSKTPPLRQEFQAAVVSSLQAIGAGDYGNVMLGSYQQDMLDTAKRTANATETLAEKNLTPPTQTKPTTLR